MSEGMRRRLEGFDRRDDVEQPDEDVLVHDIFVQLDAVHDERVEAATRAGGLPALSPGTWSSSSGIASPGAFSGFLRSGT